MSQFLSKRVSNYELFFDLAVVLAIGQLTSAIHLNHIGLQEVLAFITTNIIIFNIWHNEVLYFNKYGDSRLQDIYTIIALMFIVGNISLNFSLNIKGYYAGNPQLMLFNFLLMLAYAFIALKYFLKGKKLGFSHNIKLSILSQLSYSLPLAGLALGLLSLNIWTALIYLLPNLPSYLQQKILQSSAGQLPAYRWTSAFGNSFNLWRIRYCYYQNLSFKRSAFNWIHALFWNGNTFCFFIWDKLF